MDFFQEAVRDLEQNYTAQDGQVSLVRNRFKGGIDGMQACDNDNGLLYRIYGEFLKVAKGRKNTISNLSLGRALALTKLAPGLYHRSFHRADSVNSMDNYVATVAVAVLLDDQKTLDEIIQVGSLTGYRYDNVNPTDPNLDSWRQGSEVAWYHLAAKRLCAIWNFIWLCLAITWSAIMERTDQTSEHLLTWVRLRTLMLVEPPKALMPFFLIIKGLTWFWVWKLKRKTGGLGMEYFFTAFFHGNDPGHPLIKMAARVGF